MNHDILSFITILLMLPITVFLIYLLKYRIPEIQKEKRLKIISYGTADIEQSVNNIYNKCIDSGDIMTDIHMIEYWDAYGCLHIQYQYEKKVKGKKITKIKSIDLESGYENLLYMQEGIKFCDTIVTKQFKYLTKKHG